MSLAGVRKEGWMEIGLGVDAGAGLTFAEHRDVARTAARRGYESCWTPSGVGQDAFLVCAQWWAASREVLPGGLATGISVVPVPIWTAPALATAAATLGELTEGRFTLGVGSGSIHNPAYRHSLGLPDWAPLPLMRDYLLTVRALLAGERLDYEGPALRLHGVSLGRRPPPVPVVLGALGPRMLRLAGEVADGAALNWCTPEQVAWSREQVAAGAARTGRDAAGVRIVEYIRICVDEDEPTARRAYTRAIMGYALAPQGGSKEHGYRAHFARMGFDAALSGLEARRDRGATQDELIEQFPDNLLRMVGYYGPAAYAAAAFARLARGLDTAIVRVVPARRGVEAVLAVLEACRPELVWAAGA
jgi:alkanesulfonate monooxygenase SsuD/methylene tetrahydromethanopterin reductase-like flavin-dependent oxidoreductase (luciferase family)